MTIRMGYWDCPACNTKRIQGVAHNCPTCGNPRGPNIQFYTDDAAEVVEDPAMVARARAGADWACRFCGADNRAGVLDCQRCGAGPDGSKRRQESVQMFQPPAPPPKKFPLGLVLGLVFAFLSLTGVGCWALFLRTTALKATVEQITWTKSVQTERKEVQRKEAWADDLPSDAREIRRTTKTRTEKVQEGTVRTKVGRKNLGNGMFEDVYEEKPKYVEKQVSGTWVTYEVDRWVNAEKLKREALGGKEPDYPPFSPSTTLREGSRASDLTFALLGSDGKKYEYTCDASKDGAAKVGMYKVGGKYTAMVNAMGTVMELKP